jgi:hypothetical protein
MNLKNANKTKTAIAIGAITMTATFALQTAQAANLQAAVAKADISPSPGGQMWGYSNRSGPGEGSIDPLMAKVLVLADGKTAVAIVTLDLGRTLEDELLEKIRADVAKTGMNTVTFVASHTHHAPSVELGEWPSKSNAWVTQAAHKITQAILSAAGNLRDAKIGVGYGEVDEGHNRRHHNSDGTIQMRWRNAERAKTSPVDKTVTVLRVDSADGKPMTLLVNYACHPVVLGPDNLKYSADWCGVMMKNVEAELGTQCMFAQGACGDINPYVDKTPLAKGGLASMTTMGERIAKEVARIGQSIETVSAKDGGSVKYVTRQFQMQPRWNMTDPESKAAIFKRYAAYIERMGKDAIDKYLGRYVHPMDAQSTTIVINDEIAMAGFPGEFFVEFQTDLRRRSPAKHTMFFGYADGYWAYFPTIQAAAEGGYGADYQTFVAVGTGEELVDRAVMDIHELMGHWSKAPGTDVADFPGQTDDLK